MFHGFVFSGIRKKLFKLCMAALLLFFMPGCVPIFTAMDKTIADNTAAAQNTEQSSKGYGYKWVPPVVQKLRVPAMIRAGVYIPEHETYVIVNQGAYVSDNSRLNEIRRKYNLPAGVKIDSPLKGDDAVVAVFRIGKILDKTTVVDIKKIAFLLEGRPMDEVLSLLNGEIAQIGGSLCSFNRQKGQDSMVVHVSGDKGIETYSITASHLLVMDNGYVLAPVFNSEGGANE